MGLHKPFDRHLFLIEGAVKTSGGSLQLAKGQLGIFNVDKVGREGSQAVSSFLGQPKNTKYEMKLGSTSGNIGGRGSTNKPFSTFPFTVSDVVGLEVSAPASSEPKVDEVVIGYNGIDDSTSLHFEIGERNKLVIRLSGEPVETLGYKGFVDVVTYLDAPECPPVLKPCDGCDPCGEVDCLPIVLKAIEELRNTPLKGGMKVSELVDITPIHKCANPAELDTEEYVHVKLKVCDMGDASALSLVQTQYPDLKIERVNRVGIHSYYETLVPEGETPDDFVSTLPDYFATCAECEEGFDLVEGGFMYVGTIEDDGEDLSSDFPIEVEKVDGQVNGVGTYVGIVNTKVTDADITTLVETNPTATLEFVGKVKDLCESDFSEDVAWVEGEICELTVQEYIIDVPDDECGNDRLADLQLAFPHLDIELEGTTGGCQHRYITTVKTNLVCEECDPIFKDYYKSEAPGEFEGRKWKLKEPIDMGTPCLCGIRVKGKLVQIVPDECLIDEMGFMYGSTRIQASGGFLTEVRMGDELQQDRPFHVEHLTFAEDLTHLGANLRQFEDRSFAYFSGVARANSMIEKFLKDEVNTVKPMAQYIDYAVTIKRSPYYSQSFSGRENEATTFHVMVEVGRQSEVEELLNKLAAAAGIAPVKA